MTRIFAVLWLTCALWVVTATAIASVNDLARAKTALGDGDYKLAQELLRPLAENGRVEAMFQLGRMYQHGWGVAKDQKLAFQ